jgi:membrane protein DedA with SNARE-associated domain
MVFKEFVPFAAGLIFQGESGLFAWLLYYSNQPWTWIWICLTAIAFSNFSFTFYFYLGRFAESSIKIQKKIEPLLKRAKSLKINFENPGLIIFLRFLFGVRNAITVLLGIKKYPLPKFFLLNFLGSLIWITGWFGLFYLIRSGVQQILIIYRHYLYAGYILFLGIWIIISAVEKMKSAKN